MSEDALLNNVLQKKRNNFTIIPNALINDDSIGERAKAVYMYLASKPTNWSFKVGEIQSHFKQSITNPIKELEQSRWLCRVKKPIKGKGMGFRLIWYIAEKPFMVEQIEEMHAQREKEPVNKHIPTTPDFNDGRCATMVVANDDRKPTMMVENPVYNNTDYLSNTNSTPYSPPKGECQSPEDFDSRNQGKNLSDQPKEISETNIDKFFPGSSGSKDDEQIPNAESLRSSKNKESSQNQKFLRRESNISIVQLTNEESVNDRVFEELWQAYVPYVTEEGRSTNKGPKKPSKEKFMKTISKGVNPNDVLRGTRRYIEDCHNHKCLTKNVTTFLNQEQWRDYLVACNIKNNHPLNISELTPFGSKEDFMGFFSQETYKPFINDNPSFFETIQNIRTGLTNGNIEKSILMAQELANEVWEYKDTTQIKNSILDPNLWALCRFEINPRESKSAIMIVGYFLRRLWLEEKRQLVENKS